MEEQILAMISGNPKTSGINEDTFSVMMTSKVFSLGWVLGVGTFAFQMTLIVIILIGYYKLSNNSTPFDAPIRVTNEVRIGQFSAVILSLLSQQDIWTAIDALIVFRSSSPANNERGFYRLLVDDDNDGALQRGNGKECATWFVRAILPNCLKLIQGFSVLFVALIVIIRSDELVKLLRDFTALYFLSEIDNIVFRVASQGYFGENLKARTEKVKNVKQMDETTNTTSCAAVERFIRYLKIFVLFALAVSMFSYLVDVMKRQLSGKFVSLKYPDCNFNNSDKDPLNIGDNTCDGILNNEDCGFDGDDCTEFKIKYPGCPIPADTTLLGDGFCNGGVYDTIQCARDDGDCDQQCPDVPESEKITTSIATGDFDNDSHHDIVFGNCLLSNQLLFNNGDGSFGNAIDLPGRGSYKQCTTSIASADLNGDGYIDIVVGRKQVEGRTSLSNNTIMWNNGDGTFNEEVLLNSVIDTQVIEIADLNNDSFPDIIFGNSKESNNSIMWNQGNKTFIEQNLTRSVDYDTRSILVDSNQAIFFGNYTYGQRNMFYKPARNPGDIDFDTQLFLQER